MKRSESCFCLKLRWQEERFESSVERRQLSLIGTVNSKRNWHDVQSSLETYFDEPFSGRSGWFLPWKRIRGCWHEATSILNYPIQRREIDGKAVDGRTWIMWKIDCFWLSAILNFRYVTLESRYLLPHDYLRRRSVCLIRCHLNLLCTLLSEKLCLFRQLLNCLIRWTKHCDNCEFTRGGSKQK